MNTHTTILKNRSALLFIACAVLLITAAGTRSWAAEPGKTQHLADADAVPEGLAAFDWASIRAAYEAHRHAAVAVEGAHQARNPGQQWLTKFDGRGFLTRPDTGGWEWGLELRSYGFAGAHREQIAGKAAEVKVEGQRVIYHWPENVHEWFVNDQRGLEHGFTIQNRPQRQTGADGRLQFDLAVRGGLRPELSPDGLAVRFVDEDGASVINYAGLKVWDADGKSLPAQFEPAEEGVRLSVDERGARYPITVDPVAQQAYLKASNTDGRDEFGRSVAISGDTVVIGAPFEDSNARAVNGNQSDNSANDAGAAYVFVRSGATWAQQAYLKASNADAFDQFGRSVAISGNTIVIGAFRESSNARSINGNQTDNSADSAGAAYVFVRSGATWTQQAYLKASNAEAGDGFGVAVAIFGERLVIGATGEASNAKTVNGDQSDNTAAAAGAAYIFVRSSTTWVQEAYLKASNTDAGDIFGGSVAISGDTVVIGAPAEDSNGTQSDNSKDLAGAAYVFVRRGGSWLQEAYLKASNPDGSYNSGIFNIFVGGDFFGCSVAISGETIVVGAFGEASTVPGDQSDNSALDAGAVYVFVRKSSGEFPTIFTFWEQQAYLKSSDPNGGDYFGESVAILGDTLVVGASGEDSAARGVNGNQFDDSAPSSGAAYVFGRRAATWVQQTYLKASNTHETDLFGESVAIAGDTVVVGAPYEDSGGRGVNGDQSDTNTFEAGAAYVFPGVGRTVVQNISTRMRVDLRDFRGIGGFIISGDIADGPKRVLIRGIGPSLTRSGVPEVLTDPVLELYDSRGELIVSNNNWRDSQEQEIAATGIPPMEDRESAVLATLLPGNYTAVLGGRDDGTGTGLVEVYDLDRAGAPSRLANISTRAHVGTGSNVMIGGFILGAGDSDSTLIVRGIGPSLGKSGVTDALQDPMLELRDVQGTVLISNDNWQDNPNSAGLISASGIPPEDDREAAIAATLVPGQYTAILSGNSASTGIGLIEVYHLTE